MDITHHFLDHGDLVVKQIDLKADQFVVQHKHTYDHFGILAKGRVWVFNGDVGKIYEAPACIPILRGINHSVRALTDATWMCVHATDEKDEAKLDKVITGG